MKFRQAQENIQYKKKLRRELVEMISQEVGNDEIIDKCQQHMSSTSLGNVDITVLVSAYIVKWIESV